MNIAEHVAAAEAYLIDASRIPLSVMTADNRLLTAQIHAQLALALHDGGGSQKVLTDLLADLDELAATDVMQVGDLRDRIKGALAALTGDG